MKRFFSVALPLFNTDPLAPSAGGHNPRGITCEFCQCRLDAEGGVLKRSAVAKAYAEQADTIARIETELAAAKAAATELQTQLDAAKAAASVTAAATDKPAARSWWGR